MTKEYVYLLSEIGLDHKRTGLYKIGLTTTNIQTRRGQLKAGNPRRLETLFAIQVASAQPIETQLHRLYKEQRVRGIGGGDEWFLFTNSEIQQVIQTYKKLGSPVEQFRYIRLKKMLESPRVLSRLFTPSPPGLHWIKQRRTIALLLVLFPPLGVVLLNCSAAPNSLKTSFTFLSVSWFPLLIQSLTQYIRSIPQ